jgi:DNA topoisomerase-2
LIDIVQATLDVANGKKPKKMTPSWDSYNVDVAGVGPNQYEITGKVEILNTSSVRVSELPPGLSLDDFRKRLIKMEDEGEIVDFDDNSSERIDIEIQLKRGSLKGWTEKKVIDFLKIREKITERIVVLDWNQNSIKQYNDPREVITDFVNFRLNVYVDRFKRLLDEADYELIYWKMIKALFENGFMKKLGTFSNKALMMAEVKSIATKAKLSPHEEQIEKAVSLPTYRWTTEFQKEVDTKIAEIEANIKEYKLNLGSPKRIQDIYISELTALKKLKAITP